MPANWPTCTTVQLPASAYSANTSWWLFASPPVWMKVTTMYSSCPASSNAEARRSDGGREAGWMDVGVVLGVGIALDTVRPPDGVGGWTDGSGHEGVAGFVDGGNVDAGAGRSRPGNPWNGPRSGGRTQGQRVTRGHADFGAAAGATAGC